MGVSEWTEAERHFSSLSCGRLPCPWERPRTPSTRLLPHGLFPGLVRYPGESNPEPKQGVGSHRDGGVLTLLLVEPGKGGLQVEYQGKWIDAPQVPGTFVVNIGEMLELATTWLSKGDSAPRDLAPARH